jgi:hypothetical protein
MNVTRQADGQWVVTTEANDSQEPGSRYYRDALARYLNAFEAAFSAAADRSEFEFISCLLRVRGLQDAGWDPYETTLRAIKALVKLHQANQEADSARHLGLWIYGHIVEASEPYELLANLLDVANGGRFLVDRFPRVGGTATRPGRPQSPGEKIDQLEATAQRVGLPQLITPLKEIWDRELRNGVFHADYSFHGAELRLLNPLRIYTLDDQLRLQNRALAYHEALAAVNQAHRESYTEPVQIPVTPEFSHDPEEVATVMVKDGRGVIGLKDSWTREQIAAGKVPFCLARFTMRDEALHLQDPARAHFPAEET